MLLLFLPTGVHSAPAYSVAVVFPIWHKWLPLQSCVLWPYQHEIGNQGKQKILH